MSEIGEIRIEDYDYPLPDERIAKHPLAERDRCLLLMRDQTGRISTRIFSDLPSLLPPDSMLVYNNTRVINARLRFRKGADSRGALIEIFCLEPHSPADYAVNFASRGECSWTCLVGNSKRWKDGSLSRHVTLADGRELTLTASRLSKDGAASVIQFAWDNPEVTFSSIISALGEIPIPPYLNRSTEESDSADYQTVYSRIEGSVAAPTAGLHFTPSVLDAIDAAGIPRRELTLHVGAGTFQPVKSDTIGHHEMHSEFIAVSRDLIEELSSTPRRIIAVGTTSVRTLESLYHLGCILATRTDCTSCDHLTLPQWYPYSSGHPSLSVHDSMQAILHHLDSTGQSTFLASTRLMIAPGYIYRIVRGMITNFHQPRSTLLLLVSAFLGNPGADSAYGSLPEWRRLYDYALAGTYRFLSYGDACLLLR